MHHENTVKEEIRTLLKQEFDVPAEALADDYNLLDKGLIDSIGTLQLVSALEAKFHFNFEAYEITNQHLGSVTAITAFVLGKLNNAQ